MSAESRETSHLGRRRLTRTGVVVSSAMDKTIVVAVERMVQHRGYKRIVRRTTKFYAHDEKNQCGEGDKVTIVEGRPVSKLKRWRLREIIRRAPAAISAPASEAESEDKGRLTLKRGKDQEDRQGGKGPEGDASGAGAPEGGEAGS